MKSKLELEELLRIVSSPIRRQALDDSFGFEVSTVKGFIGETLIVDLNDYELLDEDLTVYRLKVEYSHTKYR